VATLAIVMRAPATGFPDASVTVPEREAPASWARNAMETRNRSAAPARARDRAPFKVTAAGSPAIWLPMSPEIEGVWRRIG
jgi:hypothetical protein